MRIYFVGSHATGKTTLSRYVSKSYNMPMISEVARGVLAEMETNLDHMRTDMDAVADFQRRVFARQVATEKRYADRFVSDRAFDNLAYAADHTTIFANMVNDSSFRDYMKWVGQGTVFFLRPHKSLLVQDGVRAGVDWDSVVRIDGMVKLLLEMYQISYLPIESLSMQERVRAIQFVLGRDTKEKSVQISVPTASTSLTVPAASIDLPELEPCGQVANRRSSELTRGAIVARELVASMKSGA